MEVKMEAEEEGWLVAEAKLDSGLAEPKGKAEEAKEERPKVGFAEEERPLWLVEVEVKVEVEVEVEVEAATGAAACPSRWGALRWTSMGTSLPLPLSLADTDCRGEETSG